MVDDLEELLLGPGRRALGAQVVQDEHGRGAHLFEELVVVHIGGRLVGGAQVIEQVGHDDEERRDAVLQAAVGDGGADVRLAAARGAHQHQPALGVLGERFGVLDAALEARLIARIGAAAATDQVIEGEAGERPQVAVALETVQPHILALLAHAATGQRLAELRMIQRQILPHEAGVVAVGTDLVNGGRCFRCAFFPRSRGLGFWLGGLTVRLRAPQHFV